jgi:hypothetical protein
VWFKEEGCRARKQRSKGAKGVGLREESEACRFVAVGEVEEEGGREECRTKKRNECREVDETRETTKGEKETKTSSL